jgi:hypothetical protein
MKRIITRIFDNIRTAAYPSDIFNQCSWNRAPCIVVDGRQQNIPLRSVNLQSVPYRQMLTRIFWISLH